MLRSLLAASSLLAGVAGLTSQAAAEEKAAKPYPLQTCIVSDAKLGSMGDPVAYVHEGQELKFCCPHCVESFKEDPAKYLSKLEAARKQPATQPATQPAEKSEKDDHSAHH
jgi:YHS domain-containing protein